eukprot:3848876-Rhodomonas_salina.2
MDVRRFWTWAGLVSHVGQWSRQKISSKVKLPPPLNTASDDARSCPGTDEACAHGIRRQSPLKRRSWRGECSRRRCLTQSDFSRLDPTLWDPFRRR